MSVACRRLVQNVAYGEHLPIITSMILPSVSGLGMYIHTYTLYRCFIVCYMVHMYNSSVPIILCRVEYSFELINYN